MYGLGMPKLAGIYCRISDDSKATEKGLGVKRQEEDCRKLAERIGADIVTVWVDNDISAFSGKHRPGYAAALEAIETGAIDTLLVWHPDRLHRSPIELEHFVTLIERTGCAIRTVTAGDIDLQTPEGRLMARITGAVARKESEDKSRRITRKFAELRSKGQPAGRLGYGYGPGGVIDPERAAIVVELAGRILDGEGLTAIARDLTERGVPTSLGGQWYHTTVRVVMTSPGLAGLVSHEGRVVGQGVWEPILDRITWERVRAALDQKARTTNNRYMLTGLITCGLCGHHLTGKTNMQNGKPMHMYGCVRFGGGCASVWISRDRVDELVSEMVGDALSDPEFQADSAATVDDLAARINKAEAQLVSYSAMFDAGEIELIEWRTMRDAVVSRLDDLRDRQAVGIGLAANLSGRTPWAELSDARKRQAVSTLLSITVHPATRRGPFDPARVQMAWKR